MRRVLLVGSHKGYNLESYVHMALRELGYETAFFQYKHMLGTLYTPIRMLLTRSRPIRKLASPVLKRINERLKKLAQTFEPDLLLSVKGEVILPSTLNYLRTQLGIKSVLWYPDDPCFFESFTKHIAPYYDYVFTASKKAMPRYSEIGVKNVNFLPFACHPAVHKTVSLTYDEVERYGSDVCFVGTYYPRRHAIIDKLNEFRVNVAVYGPYWQLVHRKNVHRAVFGPDMVKVINAAKIVLDIYDQDVLDYQVSARTFEVTGSGCFLLTEKAYGIEELFTVGREIVCYRGLKDLLELISYYLSNPDERLGVALKGQERAYKDHTYIKRVKELLARVGV